MALHARGCAFLPIHTENGCASRLNVVACVDCTRCPQVMEVNRDDSDTARPPPLSVPFPAAVEESSQTELFSAVLARAHAATNAECACMTMGAVSAA